MQEIRYAKVNNREIPVMISDEKGALLAAKAAGRAIVGLWKPGHAADDLSVAVYVVERLSDVDDEFLERVARRHLGLPWRICETERLLIREMTGDDFHEVWENQIGRGFGTLEELEAYTRHQYTFYEFGFWAVLEKESGDLVGIAGLTVPREEDGEELEIFECRVPDGEDTDFPERTALPAEGAAELELGYHIFLPYRRKGYGRECCLAIMKYGREMLGIGRFLVRIRPKNEASKRLADSLGFKRRRTP